MAILLFVGGLFFWRVVKGNSKQSGKSICLSITFCLGINGDRVG